MTGRENCFDPQQNSRAKISPRDRKSLWSTSKVFEKYSKRFWYTKLDWKWIKVTFYPLKWINMAISTSYVQGYHVTYFFNKSKWIKTFIHHQSMTSLTTWNFLSRKLGGTSQVRKVLKGNLTCSVLGFENIVWWFYSR